MTVRFLDFRKTLEFLNIKGMLSNQNFRFQILRNPINPTAPFKRASTTTGHCTSIMNLYRYHYGFSKHHCVMIRRRLFEECFPQPMHQCFTAFIVQGCTIIVQEGLTDGLSNLATCGIVNVSIDIIAINLPMIP